MHEVERVCRESFKKNPDETLLSPPDVFAVACLFVKVTGTYRAYSSADATIRSRTSIAERDGALWRKVLDKTHRPSAARIPKSVTGAWRRLVKRTPKPLSQLAGSKSFVMDALFLIAAADEACAGVGIPGTVDSTAGGYFEFLAEMQVSSSGTLCRNIPATSVRVLPKQHTPQSGLNVRSLTHHLALCSSSEVTPKWWQMPLNTPGGNILNILLAPWPLSMDSSDVRPAVKKSSTPGFGYFDYVPYRETSDAAVQRWVKGVLDGAARIGQRVDVLVLPECALTQTQWQRVSKLAVEREVAIISGVRAPPLRGGLEGQNSLRMRLPFYKKLELVQFKHHRWKLEASQIKTYGIGGTLCTKTQWWENISVQSRELTFLALLPELVLCPLICEDLARQDPVAELVRSVGPNLVLALLMDGPQLAERWSARYATVLADDPGSSVLTLSSFGMVKLSRPARKKPSRVFASWKDATGQFVPLSLGPADDALLLNLQFTEKREWTVDGRHDGSLSSTPVLCGIHPISVEAV